MRARPGLGARRQKREIRIPAFLVQSRSNLGRVGHRLERRHVDIKELAVAQHPTMDLSREAAQIQALSDGIGIISATNTEESTSATTCRTAKARSIGSTAVRITKVFMT